MASYVSIEIQSKVDPKVISMMMTRVKRQYSVYINRLEGRSGRLWEGKYIVSSSRSEVYLISCL
jgi:putative transposase